MVDVLSYASVNDAINEVFFDGRFAAQPVYLSMDNAMRSEIAARLSIDASAANEAICAAVRATLDHSADPYAGHASSARRWQADGMRTPPPFSAVLYSLAYAAELMEEEGHFASSNYYIRLEQVTEIERELLRRGMKRTEPLWIALNEWLVANNHVLGRPTAFTNGSTWRYVDWPVSQAIVRASDRDRFHDLFERYGFTGSETLSRREMGYYLDGWIRTGRANGRLRNAWSKKELRDRVSEAAIAELATWNVGGSTGTAERRATRLSLLANIAQRVTGPSLELHLGFFGEQDEPAILESGGNTYQLANQIYGSFATISPSPFHAGNSGLGRSHSFIQAGNGGELRWVPRLIIPFVRSVQGSLWVETMRVTFAVPHMLLVRDTNNLPRKVELHLTQAVTTKPTLDLPQGLKGLPSGWVLYNDVIISKMVDAPASNDLDCLMPLDDGGVLELSGGLKLLPKFYHSSSHPVARLAVPDGIARIEAFPTTSRSVLSSMEGDTEASLVLDPVALGQNDIELRGYQNGKLVEVDEVFFRDANRPTPLHRAGRDRLSYVTLLSATSNETQAAPSVSGMVTRGLVGELPVSNDDQPEVTGALLGGHEEAAQEAVYSRTVEQQTTLQACIENGYHIWRFPMVPPNTARGTPFEGRCASCDQTLVVLYRPRGKAQPTAVAQARPKLESIRVPIRRREDALDHDLLLDALSFLGKGSWGDFESVLDSISPDHQYARQVAQQFGFLGHLDLELRQGPGAIKFWSMPAPVVNYTGAGYAYLSGFRGSRLIADLSEAVAHAGGSMSQKAMDGGPSGFFITGIEATSLAKAVGSISDPHGRAVEVNDEAARRLAAACLTMPTLESWLKPVSIGRTRNLQRFDLRAGNWKDMERVSGSGCYRWNEGYQAYAFVDERGSARAGPYQVTKLLAARTECIRLHVYEPKSQEFLSALGSEPPGLLSRALVACSGRLPTRKGSTLLYTCVPFDVGHAIMNLLYPRGAQ